MKQDPIRSPYLSLAPGDALPLERARGPFGPATDPAWYILTCGRQRHAMVGAAAWLVQSGAIECWFPTDRRTVKRRRAGRVFHVVVDVPVVPGLIFVQAARVPCWDVIHDRRRLRPMQIGDRPVQVSLQMLAEMQGVPERIIALDKAARVAAAAARDAMTPGVGDDAVVTLGPFRGRAGQVKGIDGPRAVICIDGLRLDVDVATLERRA